MNTDENAINGSELVSIGEAVKALKEGKRIAREGWNGQGRFVFRQVPAKIPISVVPNMQSLPQSVKNEFFRRHEGPVPGEPTDECFSTIKYVNQMCIVHPDNTIDNWAPSVSDSLAEDWIILD